jgi:DNA transformation protein
MSPSALISDLPNLGPKSQHVLAMVGITNIAQLRKVGSVAAYASAKQANAKVSLNLLWALEGALTGLSWQTVAREYRTSLLLALEDHQRSLKPYTRWDAPR